MPEGDTIFRAAAALRRILAGQRVVTFDSIVVGVEHAAFAGHVIEAVEARGKNLLIRFDDGRTLHTHLRMTGSWHIYRVGERWLKKTEAARVVLTTAEFVAVCFSAPVVRVIAAGALARDPQIASLGPDLLDPSCDLTRARTNLQAEPAREIGDAIMQQRLVAGIGNVYKSEALFVRRLSPFTRVRDLADATLDALLVEARAQLRRNTEQGGPRTTRVALAGSRYWVYLRARDPCLVCRAPIEMRRQGEQARSTYYCPRCQPEAAATGPSDE